MNAMKLSCSCLLAACLGLIACQQKMADQPRYEPLQKSNFFDDQRASRPLVEGTVARGHLEADEQLYSGTSGGEPAKTFPFPIDRHVLLRGQQRYDVFCSPCHDRAGTGQGMIVRRGYRPPPSFHIDRLRAAPPGHFFDVISHGFGVMPDYAAQVSVRDRWAIAAYIRALQLSQNAAIGDVPESDRRVLLEKKP
ncbi:MAG TPA: cytochrome c [Terriglobales bacterium]|jgi:mono/diheme cytochrome c family protein|nr:cytochrome c [Terriglobales bacterium]